MQPGANAVLLKIKPQLTISRTTLDRELGRIERIEFQIDGLLANPRQFVQTNSSGAEARRRLEMEAERGVALVVRIGESQRMPGRIGHRIDNRLIAIPFSWGCRAEPTPPQPPPPGRPPAFCAGGIAVSPATRLAT